MHVVLYVQCHVLSFSSLYNIPVNVNLRQDSIPLILQGDEVILLQSDNVQSQIELTCTVEIEGSFQWMWSGPAIMSTSQEVFANTNRTSTITLAQLSTDSAGTYDCTATYDPRSVPLGMSMSAMGSRTVTLQFESKCAVYLNNDHVHHSMCISILYRCCY